MSEMREMSEIYNSLHQCTTEYNCCKSLALGEALCVPRMYHNGGQSRSPLQVSGCVLSLRWVCFECKMPSHIS